MKPYPKYSGSVKKKSLTNQPLNRGPERKNFDFGLVAQALPISSAWTTPVAANIVRVGTGSSNRIGREIHMKSVRLRFQSDAASVAVRCLLVYDKAGNNGSAAVPAITDILQADAFTSHSNLNNKDRFVTLIDTITDCSVNTQFADEYRKINLPAVYLSDDGDIGDLATGTLILMFCAQGLGVASTFTQRLRIKYIDA